MYPYYTLKQIIPMCAYMYLYEYVCIHVVCTYNYVLSSLSVTISISEIWSFFIFHVDFDTLSKQTCNITLCIMIHSNMWNGSRIPLSTFHIYFTSFFWIYFFHMTVVGMKCYEFMIQYRGNFTIGEFLPSP